MPDICENSVLAELVQINNEASLCYAIATDRLDDESIKRCFSSLQSLHQSVVEDLIKRIRQNGGDRDPLLGTTENMLKFFYEIHDVNGVTTESDLIMQAKLTEDTCLRTMRKAILENDIQPRTRALLFKELNSLQLSHEYISSLTDMYFLNTEKPTHLDRLSG